MKKDNLQNIFILNKLFQLGVERSDLMLQTITLSPVKLKLTSLKLSPPQQLIPQLEQHLGLESLSAMELAFTGDLQGNSQLIFSPSSATMLINLIEIEERRKLDKHNVEKAILSEVGNIFYNGVMGVMSTLCEYGITYMIPKYKEGTIKNLLTGNLSPKYSIALIGTIQLYPERNLLFWFQFDSLEKLLEKSRNLSEYFDI